MIVLTSCGRLGFDTPSQDADDPTSDASLPDDATAALVDAPPGDATLGDAAPLSACSPSVTMPLSLGMRTLVDTCTGNRDLIDACGPPSTREVVFAFTPPTTRGYNIGAYNPGTTNVMNSTGRINAACNGTTSCSGISGFTGTAGQTIYFVFEAASGGCAMGEVLIE